DSLPSAPADNGSDPLALADLGGAWEGIDAGTLTQLPSSLSHRQFQFAATTTVRATAVADGHLPRRILLLDPANLPPSTVRQRLARRLRRVVARLIELASPISGHRAPSQTAILTDEALPLPDALGADHPLADPAHAELLQALLAAVPDDQSAA